MHLCARQADGCSLRQHLQAAARAEGQPDPRLLAQPPAEASALWAAFVDLSAERPSGMGLGAIPSTAIEAWQRLRGVRFTGWEVDTLQAMDRAALAAAADNQPTGARSA